MRRRQRWTVHEQPLRSHSDEDNRIGSEPGRAKGAHRTVSAVSAENVGGTLPEKRFSPRALRHSVPVRHARVGWETERAAARHTA